MTDILRRRLPSILQTLGASLLLVAVGLPISIRLLHKFGVFEGWEGFGFFVIGLRTLPWMAGLGIFSLVLGTALRRKKNEAST